MILTEMDATIIPMNTDTSTDAYHDHDPAVERARRIIRSSSRCTIADGLISTESRYLINPANGDLICAIDRAHLDADDVVLVIPEDHFDAPVRLSVELIENQDEICSDRYLAYHTPADMPHLGIARVGFAKLDSGEVIDRETLSLSNPFVKAIPSLCKQLNADRDKLRECVGLFSGSRPEHPVAVSADECGFDVRGDFSVIRIEYPSPAEDPDDCARVIAALLENDRDES